MALAYAVGSAVEWRAGLADEVTSLGQCGRARSLEVWVDEVTFLVEMVVDVGVFGSELL